MSAVPLPVATLAAVSHLAPSLVAPFFRRMMLKPRRHLRPPPPLLELPAADERLGLGDGLVAWRWGEGPPVLLVHGFEGHRAQFAAILAALRQRGLAAVALDVPAHGESAGEELTAVKFIAAIDRALAALGPLPAVVGHSMGGAMSLYALARRGGAGRAVLIAAPSSLKRELQRFATAVGLSPRGARAFIASVERHVGQPAADFDVRHLVGRIDLPLLLIHDQDDRRVPVVEAARAAHALPDAELMITRGLGHNRLLGDPVVVRAVVDFVAAQETMGSERTV
ncbi:alpha/beta hydrolase [Reyranella sp.]|uniref:alpha/beta hydrolase n=1 Tax=Reyranella sp. TaxID=1929291 RepID=UPI003BAC60C0